MHATGLSLCRPEKGDLGLRGQGTVRGRTQDLPLLTETQKQSVLTQGLVPGQAKGWGSWVSGLLCFVSVGGGGG